MNIFTKALAITGLMAMSSFASAGPINLGAAGDYTMLAVGTPWTGQSGGFLQLGSEAEIYGNVGARGEVQWRKAVTGPSLQIGPRRDQRCADGTVPCIRRSVECGRSVLVHGSDL